MAYTSKYANGAAVDEALDLATTAVQPATLSGYAKEISGQTAKTSLATNDAFAISDSEASGVQKKIIFGNILNALSNTYARKISTPFENTSISDNDLFPAADSAYDNIQVKIKWSNIKSVLKTYFDTLYGAAITGGASSIVSSNLTANRTLVSDGSGKVGVSPVTSIELGYVSGVTSAIQTQLNGKLANTVEDTTPQLGGELDANEHSIGSTEHDNGNSGTSKAIDWRLGNHQKVTMTGNCTFTFTAPSKAGMYSLRIIQDATGSRTVTLPTMKKPGGTAFTFTTAANAIDILSIYYDGTSYYGQVSANFS